MAHAATVVVVVLLFVSVFVVVLVFVFVLVLLVFVLLVLAVLVVHPAIPPHTLNTPHTCHTRDDSGSRIAKLLNKLYPVIATMSSKLAAATTVDGIPLATPHPVFCKSNMVWITMAGPTALRMKPWGGDVCVVCGGCDVWWVVCVVGYVGHVWWVMCVVCGG